MPPEPDQASDDKAHPWFDPVKERKHEPAPAEFLPEPLEHQRDIEHCQPASEEQEQHGLWGEASREIVDVFTGRCHLVFELGQECVSAEVPRNRTEDRVHHVGEDDNAKGESPELDVVLEFPETEVGVPKSVFVEEQTRDDGGDCRAEHVWACQVVATLAHELHPDNEATA